MNTSSQNVQTTPLKLLGPQWFAIVMGLAGLALAWAAAVPKKGNRPRAFGAKIFCHFPSENGAVCTMASGKVRRIETNCH